MANLYVQNAQIRFNQEQSIQSNNSIQTRNKVASKSLNSSTCIKSYNEFKSKKANISESKYWERESLMALNLFLLHRLARTSLKCSVFIRRWAINAVGWRNTGADYSINTRADETIHYERFQANEVALFTESKNAARYCTGRNPSQKGHHLRVLE